ncbi:hypothetical protein ACVRX9_10530, partial [Streptococcus oricebi]
MKVDLPSLQAQASSMATIAAARSAAYDHTIEALLDFINDGSLQGEAYSASKSYASSRNIPYLRGAKLLVERLAEASQALVDKYIAEVGSESLDEDELQSKIESLQAVIHTKTNLYNTLFRLDDISNDTLGAITKVIDSAKDELEKTREKLQKLRAFFASSASVLEGIADLQTAVTAGADQLALDAQTYGGQVPNVQGVAQPNWVQTIDKHIKQQREKEVKKADPQEIERQKIAKMSKAELLDEYGDIISSNAYPDPYSPNSQSKMRTAK